MEAAENLETPQRDHWMAELLKTVNKLEAEVEKAHYSDEVDKRIESDLKLTQFMRELDVSELIREEQYIEIKEILTQHLADVKLSYDLYVTTMYNDNGPTYANKNLVTSIECCCYIAVFLANISADIDSRLKNYSPFKASLENSPPTENIENKETRNEAEKTSHKNCDNSEPDFASLKREYLLLADQIKDMVGEIVQKATLPKSSPTDYLYNRVIGFFKTAYDMSFMVPPFLTIPLLLLQVWGPYHMIYYTFPRVGSSSIGGILKFIDVQDNIIMAFFVKHVVVVILKVVLQEAYGKQKLSDLENGMNYQSFRFVKSMIFNAFFLKFYQELGKNRTWASLLMDTAVIEILSYLDELCFNLYSKMSAVSLCLIRSNGRS